MALRDLTAAGLVDHVLDDGCHVGDSPEAEAGASGRHDTNLNVPHGSPEIVIQLAPYVATPDPGGVYKAWILPLARYLANGGQLESGSQPLCGDAQEPRPCLPQEPPTGFAPDAGFGPPHREARTDNFKVNELTGNHAPVADAGPDQTVVPGATVTLDGSGSTDVDGDPLTYQWTLQSAPPGSGAVLSDPSAVMPTLVADLPGTYAIQLVVHDGVASSAPDTVQVRPSTRRR